MRKSGGRSRWHMLLWISVISFMLAVLCFVPHGNLFLDAADSVGCISLLSQGLALSELRCESVVSPRGNFGTPVSVRSGLDGVRHSGVSKQARLSHYAADVGCNSLLSQGPTVAPFVLCAFVVLAIHSSPCGSLRISVPYNGTSAWALSGAARPPSLVETLPCLTALRPAPEAQGSGRLQPAVADRALTNPSAAVVGFRALLPRGLLVSVRSLLHAAVPPFPVFCLRFGLRFLRLSALVPPLLWWAATPCLAGAPPPCQAFLCLFGWPSACSFSTAVASSARCPFGAFFRRALARLPPNLPFLLELTRTRAATPCCRRAPRPLPLVDCVSPLTLWPLHGVLAPVASLPLYDLRSSWPVLGPAHARAVVRRCVGAPVALCGLHSALPPLLTPCLVVPGVVPRLAAGETKEIPC